MHEEEHPEVLRCLDHLSAITQLLPEKKTGIPFSAVLSLCLCLFVTRMFGAQASSEAVTPAPAFNGLPSVLDNLHEGSELHILVIVDNKTRLGRQAVAKLHCNYPEGTVFQTTKRDSETTFFNLRFGKYDLDISAVEYFTSHQTIQVTGLKERIDLQVTMRRDPMAVSFDSVRTSDALMSSRGSRETQRAIQAFKSGNLKEAKKHLQAAYKLVPSNSRVNFLLGYQAFQQKKFNQAQTYPAGAPKPTPIFLRNS